MKTFRAYLSALLIAALVFTSLPVAAAPTAPQEMDVASTGQTSTERAPVELVSTQSVLAGDRASADRERINDILARADVQDQLLKQGVNPDDVEARVAALSDAEAKQMAEQLEQLPAGAGVIGALFAVFIILLITDILGLTDVYPFTR
ncbi:PA2779 family protein [Vreelandella zhaodongensis]|uniref:PA2779 family protein n=1 Tax=Vreelandella zhaodongensis TaxID=1176240 RepID=UPI003EBD9CE6